ncbi:MAG: VWA domain-containing protein [Kofleriaceae bacterium]
MRAAFAVLICLYSRGAAADPVVHAVTAKLVGNEAVFAVRVVAQTERTARVRVELPARGVVTAATVNGRRLALAAIEAVERAVAAIAERDPSPRTTRRSLVAITTEQPGTVDIEVFLPTAGTLVLELAVTAPTCFARDTRYVAVPHSWRSGLAVLPRDRASVAAEHCPTPRDVMHDLDWVAFANPLTSRASGIDRINTIASRLAADPGRHVAQVEVALAARLTEVPSDLATVILVDGSRSISPREAETQRALIASYLRVAPRSQVQVLVYARSAPALLPAWTSAVQAAPRIDRELQARVPKNGSDLDVALREAGAWLARVTGTKRIVILTDELLPSRIAADSLQALVPAGTLVNTVALRENLELIMRDDDVVLAPLAKATRGISTIAGGEVDATMLARPIALENMVLKSPGWKQLASDSFCTGTREEPARLVEGTTCTWLGLGSPIAGPIVLEGQLWNEPVVRVVRPDPGRGRTLARALTTTTLSIDADGEQQQAFDTAVARAAHAVGAAWSLYAEWGGSGGYSDLASFGFGRSGMVGGCCGIGDIGIPLPPVAPVIDTRRIGEQLARSLGRCAPDREHPIRASVEVVLSEIIDVQVTAGSPAQRSCAEEAIWSTWLVSPVPSRHLATVVVTSPQS